MGATGEAYDTCKCNSPRPVYAYMQTVCVS